MGTHTRAVGSSAAGEAMAKLLYMNFQRISPNVRTYVGQIVVCRPNSGLWTRD